MTRPIKVAVIGGGRSAGLLVQAVLAAGVAVLSVEERRIAKAQHGLKRPSEPNPSPWDTGSRTRAQWKDETQKRGRNR